MWRKAIEVLDDDVGHPRTMALFPEDRCAGIAPDASIVQDSGVGTIMGTKTFGKGVVQTIYPLPDGSAVKITTARYLTPRNRDINHLGITPDVVVGENKHPQYGTPIKDDQLEHALQYLNEKLAKLSVENGV